MRRRRAEPRRPGIAHQVVVAADAAGSDDDRLRAQLEAPRCSPGAWRAPRRVARLQHGACDALDDAVRHDELIDPVPEPELEAARPGRRAHPLLERLDDARPGAPGDVEPWHGVAGAGGEGAATFGPADDGRDAVAHLAQPGLLLAGGPLDVRPRPLPGQFVLRPVEPRGAQPVLPRQLQVIADPQPPLFRRVHEEQPAERPPGLAAERLLGLLVEQQHAPPGLRRLGRRRQPGQPRPHHDHISVDDRTSSIADSA